MDPLCKSEIIHCEIIETLKMWQLAKALTNLLSDTRIKWVILCKGGYIVKLRDTRSDFERKFEEYFRFKCDIDEIHRLGGTRISIPLEVIFCSQIIISFIDPKSTFTLL